MSAQNNEVLIEVKGVSKKFAHDLRKSLWYGFQDVILAVFGAGKNRSRLRKDEFWAVSEMNFQLRRGESLGLIGHNGAGKSTMLKMLNGLIRPDKGSITVHGKVGALIELGAGFNPILTGRENVYINGQLLGFSKKEIDSKLDDIIAFAEIHEFIDMPVQNYSSGMKVRLGFAVAAQLEPDVLTVDEVLAVGDMGFRMKCYARLDQLASSTAVIFVSHSMPQVSRLCTHVMLMSKGTCQYYGNDVGKGIEQYYDAFRQQGRSAIALTDALSFEAMKVTSALGDGEVAWGSPYQAHIQLNYKRGFAPELHASLIVFDKEQRPIGIAESSSIELEENVHQNGGTASINMCVKFDDCQLSKGNYSFTLVVTKGRNSEPLLRVNQAANFKVVHPQDIWQPMLFRSEWEVVS